MVDELKKAVDKVEKLSETKQKEIARLIVNEIGWDQTLANSQDKLSSLAQEALDEYKSGETKPFSL